MARLIAREPIGLSLGQGFDTDLDDIRTFPSGLQRATDSQTLSDDALKPPSAEKVAGGKATGGWLTSYVSMAEDTQSLQRATGLSAAASLKVAFGKVGVTASLETQAANLFLNSSSAIYGKLDCHIVRKLDNIRWSFPEELYKKYKSADDFRAQHGDCFITAYITGSRFEGRILATFEQNQATDEVKTEARAQVKAGLMKTAEVDAKVNTEKKETKESQKTTIVVQYSTVGADSQKDIVTTVPEMLEQYKKFASSSSEERFGYYILPWSIVEGFSWKKFDGSSSSAPPLIKQLISRADELNVYSLIQRLDGIITISKDPPSFVWKDGRKLSEEDEEHLQEHSRAIEAELYRVKQALTAGEEVGRVPMLRYIKPLIPELPSRPKDVLSASGFQTVIVAGQRTKGQSSKLVEYQASFARPPAVALTAMTGSLSNQPLCTCEVTQISDGSFEMISKNYSQALAAGVEMCDSPFSWIAAGTKRAEKGALKSIASYNHSPAVVIGGQVPGGWEGDAPDEGDPRSAGSVKRVAFPASFDEPPAVTLTMLGADAKADLYQAGQVVKVDKYGFSMVNRAFNSDPPNVHFLHSPFHWVAVGPAGQLPGSHQKSGVQSGEGISEGAADGLANINFPIQYATPPAVTLTMKTSSADRNQLVAKPTMDTVIETVMYLSLYSWLARSRVVASNEAARQPVMYTAELVEVSETGFSMRAKAFERGNPVRSARTAFTWVACGQLAAA